MCGTSNWGSHGDDWHVKLNAHPRTRGIPSGNIGQRFFVIIAHNHPSGDCSPSYGIWTVTANLHKAGEVLGISVVDHIIVAKEAIVPATD